MQLNPQAAPKRAWTAPKLIIHGDVAKITQKQFGWNDSTVLSITTPIGDGIGVNVTGPGGDPGDKKAKPKQYTTTIVALS